MYVQQIDLKVGEVIKVVVQHDLQPLSSLPAGVSPEMGYSSDPVRDRPSQEQASHMNTCPHICSIPAYPRAELKVGSFCGNGKDLGRNFRFGEAW